MPLTEHILEKTNNGLWVYRGEKATQNVIKIKPTTAKLLECLWPESDDEPADYSIRRVEYSVEYFTLKVQFSEKDVEEMLNSDDVETLVRRWGFGEKRLVGFNETVKAYCKKNELNAFQKKNLIWGTLSLCYNNCLYYRMGIFSLRVLPVGLVIISLDDQEIIREWFDKKIKEEGCDYESLLYVLRWLFDGRMSDNSKFSELRDIVMKAEEEEHQKKLKELENIALEHIKKDGKWGFADEAGNVVIQCKWKDAFPFKEELARVQEDNEKYGFIDKTGKVVIPCKWRGAWSFSEGMAAVMDDNWKYGFIDKTGKVVIPCKWKDTRPFSQGFADVYDDNGKRWIIDKTGTVVREFN